MRFRFFCVLGAVFLAACNPVAQLEQGEEIVERWQSLYDGGRGDRLYAMTAEEFKEVTSRDQFEDLLDVLSARLGRTVTTERMSFNVNTTAAGTRTVIVMETEFEQGLGVETYTFVGGADDLEVIGWHISSDRLVFTADDLTDAGPVVQAAE